MTATMLSAALVLGACGSNDEEAAPAAGDDAAAGASEAATPTGEPIMLGMINQENTPAGSFPEIRQAAEAAVAHLNAEGGIDGRPLELEACITQGTPEGSAACAEGFAASKPVLVMPGIDFGSAASLPILERAGIPYVGGVPLLPPELTAPNSYTFVGGSASAFPSQAVFLANELKVDKVNILYTDNPAGAQAAKAFGADILAANGVTDVQLIPEKADAADFTAALTKTAQGDPDAIMVLFAGQGCSRVMQAKGALGIDAMMFYPGSCADEAVIEAGGAGAEGAFFNEEVVLYDDLEDPEVKTYVDALAEYAPDAKKSGFSQTGFGAVMNIAELMKETSGDITTESFVAAIGQAKDKPNFMAHPYTCDREQVPGLPAVCNAFSRIVQFENGEIKDVLGKWINGFTGESEE